VLQVEDNIFCPSTEEKSIPLWSLFPLGAFQYPSPPADVFSIIRHETYQLLYSLCLTFKVLQNKNFRLNDL